jgi:hypothetical protein
MDARLSEPAMSGADIPSRFAPALKWVCATVFLAVFALGASDSLRAREYSIAAIYVALFITTFIIAVKWTAITATWSRLRGRIPMFFVALGLCGALALGIAIGGLLNRGPLGFPLQATGRIVWNFDQPTEFFFLAISRFNDQEIRVAGFQAHGKNTSTDPISEFTGFIRSDCTNEQRPLYLLAQDLTPDPNRPSFITVPLLPTPPHETFGIPALADFDVTTFDKAVLESGRDGIPFSRFVREFGPFTVVLKYDGITVERHFSAEQINAQAALLDRQTRSQNSTAPHVVRRPNATPLPSQTFTPHLISPPPLEPGAENGRH